MNGKKEKVSLLHVSRDGSEPQETCLFHQIWEPRRQDLVLTSVFTCYERMLRWLNLAKMLCPEWLSKFIALLQAFGSSISLSITVR